MRAHMRVGLTGELGKVSLWGALGVRFGHAVLLCCIACCLQSNRAFSADKSAVGLTAISLPKGPGSIEGLGDSFQPSLNTGTATYQLPLVLARGVNGFVPKLALQYEGGGAAGPLGVGWSLMIPMVQRRVDRGIPTYGEPVGFLREDTYITEGREELVPTASGDFFCKNESAFMRYRTVGDHWEATRPDGTRLIFGASTDHRIVDSDHSDRVFCWLLEREIDTHGNEILYRYVSFSGPSDLNQKYLAEIRYGAGAAPWTHFQSVVFSYESRSDWFEDGRPGFLVRTGHRLQKIETCTQGVTLTGHEMSDHNGDGTLDALNRRYELHYSPTVTGSSLLTAVRVVGADGGLALPTATFGYSTGNTNLVLSAAGRLLLSSNEPPVVMDSPGVDLVDVDGDGLPDILQTGVGGGAHQWYRNLGVTDAAKESLIVWAEVAEQASPDGGAWNFSLDQASTHLADMDGDGLADFVHKTELDEVFYFRSLGKAGWDRRRDMAADGIVPPAPYGNPSVRTADIDFDNRMDVIQSVDVGGSIAYRVWFNLGDNRYSTGITVDGGFGFSFEDPTVQLMDWNGDRVVDVGRVESSRVRIMPGLGYGHFGEVRDIEIPEEVLDDTQRNHARLTDVNGDGLVDLVVERAAPGELWFWLNQGNDTLGQKRRIIDLPSIQSPDVGVRWADVNGSGSADLIYADHEGSPRIQCIDLGQLLNGSNLPNLLLSIRNGIGRVIDLEYTPSTVLARKDDLAGHPWPAPVPFPISLVTALNFSDSLGHTYRTELRYHDGYYDPVEKQFRGFARSEQSELGDETVPTLVTEFVFDTGRVYEAMKGKMLRQIKRDTSGAVFSDETTTWADPPTLLKTGVDGREIVFAHPGRRVQDILEKNQGTPHRIESEMKYDEYGNEVFRADYGLSDGEDRLMGGDEKIHVNEFAINQDLWLIRHLKREELRRGDGTVVSRTDHYYDDPLFNLGNLGFVIRGDETMRVTWPDPSDPTQRILATRFLHDAFGNPVESFDPLGVANQGAPDFNQGHVRSVVFDSLFHTYPIRETVHLRAGVSPLIAEVEFDTGFGLILSSKDFNQQETLYRYDGLARMIAVVEPGDSLDFPTKEYGYSLAVSALATGTGLINFVETHTLNRAPGTAPTRRDHYVVSREFSDGLGRVLMHKEEAANGAVVVKQAKRFNRRQQVLSTLNPYFSLLSAPTVDAPLAFEAIEEPGWIGRFETGGKTVHLGLDTALQIRMEYDALLRMTKKVLPDGSEYRTEYEPLLTRIFDPNDLIPASSAFQTPHEEIRDGLERLIQVVEVTKTSDDGQSIPSPQRWATRYQYDANDQLTRIEDSQGNVREFTYDGMKRRLELRDPDRGTLKFRYDAASNLIETRDARGQTIRYGYDGVNRNIWEDYLGGIVASDTNAMAHRAHPVVYHYDAPAGLLDQGDGTRAQASNTIGRLAWIEDLSGEQHTSFDSRGRVSWQLKRVWDPLLQDLTPYRTSFEYDSRNQTRRAVFPDLDALVYAYDERGLWTKVEAEGGPVFAEVLHYSPSGQITAERRGNGVNLNHSYDRRQRLEESRTAAQKELLHFRYVWDGVSNLRELQDLRPASDLPSGSPWRRSMVCDYDDLYRLTRVQYSLASPSEQARDDGSLVYRYDRIGNMLEQRSHKPANGVLSAVSEEGLFSYGGQSGAWNRTPRAPDADPGPHAAVGVANGGASVFAYDSNGNVLSAGGQTNVWDVKDRLTMTRGVETEAEYSFDSADRRVWKKVVSPSAKGGSSVSAVVYVSPSFEVRSHEECIKYVTVSGNRIARTSQWFTSNHVERIQRVRVYPGWNVLTTVLDLPAEFQVLAPPLEGGQWALLDALSGSWKSLTPGTAVPAGSILGVRSPRATMLSLRGLIPSAPLQTGSTIAGFHGVTAPGGWRLPVVDNRIGYVWWLDAVQQEWRMETPLFPVLSLPVPKILSAGQVVFAPDWTVSSGVQPELEPSIVYYQADHLGSTALLTDSDGKVVYEAIYHPFGELRSERFQTFEAEPYGFTGKERDAESGWSYFEARSAALPMCRFLSPDPKRTLDPATTLQSPQSLNLYSYVANRPLNWIDPLGLEERNYDDKTKTLNVKVKWMVSFVDDKGEWTDNEKAMWKGAMKAVVESYYSSKKDTCGDGRDLKIKFNVEFVDSSSMGSLDMFIRASHDPDHRSSVTPYRAAGSWLPNIGDFDIADWQFQSKSGGNFQIPGVHEVGHSLGLHHPGGRSNSAGAYAADAPSLMGSGMILRQTDFRKAFCSRRDEVESRVKDFGRVASFLGLSMSDMPNTY